MMMSKRLYGYCMVFVLVVVAGHSVGAGVVRGLGHSTHWIHERAGIPAVPALWMSAGW